MRRIVAVRVVAGIAFAAALLLVGLERTGQMCDVCLSGRRRHRVGILWPVRFLVEVAETSSGETLLLRRLLAQHGHRHAWVSLSGGFRSLVISEVSHGRLRFDSLRLRLASSEALIARAAELIDGGQLTVAELEDALRAPDGDAHAVRVRALLESP